MRAESYHVSRLTLFRGRIDPLALDDRIRIVTPCCCPRLTGHFGRLLGTDELAWRAHAEPRVWVIVIVVFKPPAKLPKHGAGIGQGT